MSLTKDLFACQRTKLIAFKDNNYLLKVLEEDIALKCNSKRIIIENKQNDEKKLAAHYDSDFYKKYTIMRQQYKKLEDNINNYNISLTKIEKEIEEKNKDIINRRNENEQLLESII
jgi:hypothetical protein